jgi:transposase
MKTTRRKFTREFKAQAVAQMVSGDRSIEQLAKELEVDASLLYKWRRALQEHGEDAFPGKGHVHQDDDELTQLRKENAALRRERDFLKKAAAYFAKE